MDTVGHVQPDESGFRIPRALLALTAAAALCAGVSAVITNTQAEAARTIASGIEGALTLEMAKKISDEVKTALDKIKLPTDGPRPQCSDQERQKINARISEITAKAAEINHQFPEVGIYKMLAEVLGRIACLKTGEIDKVLSDIEKALGPK